MLNFYDLLDSTVEFGREGVGASRVEFKKAVKKDEGVVFKFVAHGSRDDYEVLIEYPNVKRGNYPTELKVSNNKIKIKKLTRRDPVKVRCSCSDYRFTWAFSNKMEGSFTGEKFPVYVPTGTRPPRNPDNLPGLCKHLIGAFRVLKDIGYLR